MQQMPMQMPMQQMPMQQMPMQMPMQQMPMQQMPMQRMPIQWFVCGLSFRSRTGDCPLLAIRMSVSPSLSKSPKATPRPTLGVVA